MIKKSSLNQKNERNEKEKRELFKKKINRKKEKNLKLKKDTYDEKNSSTFLGIWRHSLYLFKLLKKSI